MSDEKLIPIKYTLPATIEGWCDFKFPYALTSKANTVTDDFNLMTRFIFDKSESTFLHVNTTVDLLCESGWHQ